jgi:hypothetical protein
MDGSQPGRADGSGPVPTAYTPPALGFVHRLSFRLSVLVLIAVVPLASILAWAGVRGRDETVRFHGAEVSRLARVAARIQEQEFEEDFRLLDALASDPDLLAGSDAERAKALVAALPRSPSCVDLHLLRPDGSVVASALPAEASRALLAGEAAARATRTGLPSFSGFRSGGEAGPTVHVVRSLPAGVAGGPLVLGATVRLEAMERLQRTLQLPEGAMLDLLDDQARILLRIGGPSDAVGRAHPAPALRRDPAAEDRSLAGVDVDGRRRLFGLEVLAPGVTKQGLQIVVSTPEEVVRAPAERLLAAYLAGSGIVLVVGLVLARLFAERFVLRRVEGVVLATRRVAATDLRQFRARALERHVRAVDSSGGRAG